MTAEDFASATSAAAEQPASMSSLDAIKHFDLVYIASPYTYYPAGMDRAYTDICEVSWWFQVAGINHFSPIIYSHPLATVWGVDRGNARFWLDFDTSMMRVADALVVVELDGWADSYGVSEEIAEFEAAGKPVYYLNPVTLELRLDE